jgi:hypothetical protein
VSQVNLTYFERWFSRRHVGAARPTLIVGIRKGYFVRTYQPFTFLDGSTEDIATIPGESKGKPWWPKWTPSGVGEYKYIPGVRSAELHKSFDNNGAMSATITFDNMLVKVRAGVLGRLFRVFKRGALAPYYGVSLEGRPATTITPDEDWHELLDSEAQITIWEGYGDAMTKTFTGLIDGPIDLTSAPAVATMQVRDFSQMLTDAALLGDNKSRQLRPPIKFVDRRTAENITAVSGGAVASSSRAGHPATNVSDRDSSSTWESQGHSVQNVTEWVEIHIPRGAYETFFLYTEMNDMEMYASLYVRGTDPKMDGASIPTNQWVDLGLGNVPGANGGFPFIKYWPTTSNDRGYTHTLGHRFFVGDNTVLRLSFRHLGKSKDADGNLTYRAGVRRLAAIQREIKEEALTKKWILVDDASDIVKVVLRWAGFREWEVESFGWRLKAPIVFHQGDHLQDIINKLATYGAFVFFMGDPSNDDLSTGVPIFRYSRARAGAPFLMVTVTDHDLVTAMSAKLDRGQKASVIRARGKMTKKGFALGEDTTKRFQAIYRPPWSDPDRSSGKIKQETFYDNMLTSNAQCKVACCLIAFQMALAGAQVVVQIPGYPAFDIDDQVSVVDEGTGVNSRVYTMERTSTHTTGREATYRMTLTGALLDIPDVRDVMADLNQAVIDAADEEG